MMTVVRNVLAVLFAHAIACKAFFVTRHNDGRHLSVLRERSDMDDSLAEVPMRRLAIASVLLAPFAFTASPVKAEDQKTIYMTGKPPKVPGQKPKDKNDTSGTRKDPNFLRSIADCKSQCENRAGPDGFAKSKEDCLSECQDICCSTYEQCTFAIVPRI